MTSFVQEKKKKHCSGSQALQSNNWLQRCLDSAHKAVATLSEEALEAKRLELKKSSAAAATTGPGKKSQLSLLSGAVKRKCSDSSNEAEKKQRSNSSGTLRLQGDHGRAQDLSLFFSRDVVSASCKLRIRKCKNEVHLVDKHGPCRTVQCV